MPRRTWTPTEKQILIDNYTKTTIKELSKLFPTRSVESINNEIKRLKAAGKIKTGKEDDAIKRAYEQRGRPEPFLKIDQAKPNAAN